MPDWGKCLLIHTWLPKLFFFKERERDPDKKQAKKKIMTRQLTEEIQMVGEHMKNYSTKLPCKRNAYR